MNEALPLLLVLLPALAALLVLALPKNAAGSLTTGIAFAVFGLAAYAAVADESFAFTSNWFRFQNLSVDLRFRIPETLRWTMPCVTLVGLLASSTLATGPTEQPRLQRAACMAWLSATLAMLMSGDLVLLFVVAGAASTAWMLFLVTRTRDDAATSAAALLTPFAIGSVSLLLVVLTVTATPLPIDGGELVLSASIDDTRTVFGATASTANWLLLGVAVAMLAGSTLFPTHWGWTLLQHRLTTGGALAGFAGGLVVASALFGELAASFTRDSTWWGSRSVLYLFAVGCAGLGLASNLHESLRRRIMTVLLVPALAVPLAFAPGTADGFALATLAALAIALPACTVLLAIFAYCRQRRPGRLRDLRGSGRSMPRFGFVCVVALPLCLGLPGSASFVAFRRLFEVLSARSFPVAMLFLAGLLAASVGVLVVLVWLFRRPVEDRRAELHDLAWNEMLVLSAPLVAAFGLAWFAEDFLASQTEAFRLLGLTAGGAR